MKNLFLTIWFFFFFLICSAQTWQRTYENPFLHNAVSRVRGVKVIDDTIFVSCQFVGVLDNSTTFTHAFLSKHSITDGAQVVLKDFTTLGTVSSRWNENEFGFDQLPDNGGDTLTMVLSEYLDQDVSAGARFLKIDKFLNIVYESPLAAIAGDFFMCVDGCKSDEDGNVFAYGSRWATSNWSMSGANNFLFKLDPNGALIWSKVYDNAEYGNGVCFLSDGDILFSAVSQSEPGSWQTLIKTNPLGDEQWRFNWGTIDYAPTHRCLQRADGTILLFSAQDVYNEVDQTTTYWLTTREIEDLGASYSINQIHYNAKSEGKFLAVHGAEFIPNNQTIVWGNFESTIGSDSVLSGGFPTLPFRRGFLLKLDENLDSLWMRTYYMPDDDLGQWISEFDISDVATTPTGGFVTCGTSTQHSNSSIPQMWLMRLDEYGCLEPGCQNVSVSEIAMGFENTMSVFPNPVSDRCTVVFNSDHIKTIERQHPQTELILTDLNGQQLHRQTLSAVQNGQRVDLDFSAYASGSYQVHWISGNMWLDTLMVVKK